jgi:hypothetical protein
MKSKIKQVAIELLVGGTICIALGYLIGTGF